MAPNYSYADVKTYHMPAQTKFTDVVLYVIYNV